MASVTTIKDNYKIGLLVILRSSYYVLYENENKYVLMRFLKIARVDAVRMYSHSEFSRAWEMIEIREKSGSL